MNTEMKEKLIVEADECLKKAFDMLGNMADSGSTSWDLIWKHKKSPVMELEKIIAYLVLAKVNCTAFDSVKSGEWSVNSAPSGDSEYVNLCKRLSKALGNMAMSP